jgi:hypothetical protein
MYYLHSMSSDRADAPYQVVSILAQSNPCHKEILAAQAQSVFTLCLKGGLSKVLAHIQMCAAGDVLQCQNDTAGPGRVRGSVKDLLHVRLLFLLLKDELH